MTFLFPIRVSDCKRQNEIFKFIPSSVKTYERKISRPTPLPDYLSVQLFSLSWNTLITYTI